MATFVLVHGGGHGGWCYQLVAKLLRAQDHEVYAPSMTGLADREHLMSPAIDLDMQITDIVKLLQYEDLKDVILVGPFLWRHDHHGRCRPRHGSRRYDRLSGRSDAAETASLWKMWPGR